MVDFRLTPCPWLLLMSLTFVFGVYFTALRMTLLTAVVFLDQLV